MAADFKLKERAHAMRRDPTEPEKRLWRNLSNAQLGGFKFRRQAAIEPYIVDFLCPAKALIVEVDGDTHEAGADRTRELALERRGYRTVRFTNTDVMRNMEGVLTVLLQALRDAPDRWPGHHPNPSSKEEGLRQGKIECPSSSEEGFGVVSPSRSGPPTA